MSNVRLICGLFLGFFVLLKSLNDVLAGNDDTLELLQLLIRHGNRTATETFPAYVTWEIETFQPFQFGQLTPMGRRQMYNTGQYLRQRYSDFFPDEFSYTGVAVKCAAQARVQESSAVAMAAMFPPGKKQSWQDSGLGALYTPIPCLSVPSDQDTLLEPDSVDCPRYANMTNEYYNSSFYVNRMNKLTENSTLVDLIRSSLNLTEPMSPDDLYTVWENFVAMEDAGVPLPSWANKVYPEPLTQMSALYFGYTYYSTEAIIISTGEFIQEILDTATLLENRTLTPKSRKMFPYFGHDKTMMPLMVALGFETVPPIVSYGAAMIMELHRNKTTSEIGYKFLYRNETWADPILYVVPGCQEICPLSYVKNCVKPFIPTESFYSYC